MADLTTTERLRGLVLSASDLRTLLPPEVKDAFIEDYLTILDNLIIIAGIVDDFKIEAIATDFTDGSIPFASDSLLSQDNANIFWDAVNKRLGIGTNTPTATLDIDGTVKLPATGITGAGSGSGLDSDLLDGHDSAYFAQQTVLAALSLAFDALSLVVDGLVTWRGTGITDTFLNGDGNTVTVTEGLITGIA